MLLLLLACKPDPTPQTQPVDLVTPLSEGEVRAGVITDEAALFGGIAAEGQVGDIKLYNSRARFIVQGVRPGSYYIDYGGGIIDVDAVRPEGQPGRDVVDELGVMVGLGRLMNATRVAVISDGSDGGPAQVIAEGPGAPMTLLTGSLESEGLVPEVDVWISTCYTLEPDSPLLLMETTLTWRDDDTAIELGDVAILSSDAAIPWGAGEGLEGSGAWPAVIGRRGEIAMAIFPEDEPFTSSAAQQLLSSLGPTLAAFQASTTLSQGDTLTWRRTLGVAGSLSELTDAWYARSGVETETLSGTVTDGSEPVAGARVHIIDGDGAPVLLAQTDADGAFSLQAPAGAYTAIATGRGEGRHLAVAEGAGWYAPYTTEALQAEALQSIAQGAIPIPFADGYGISEAVGASTHTPRTHNPPGGVTGHSDHARPTTVRLAFANGDGVTSDSRIAPGRPSGLMAEGWTGTGSLSLPLEPGDYTLTAHRGLRFEPYTESFSIASGEAVDITVALEEAYDPGEPVIDPHSHAAPSGDGEIPMSHRLLTHAANGVDVHFGTDHDHIADYRPLLSALGIESWLTSIVADEVSPVLRGHVNIYPLSAVIGEPNNGALAWWKEVRQTPELYALLREQLGEDGIIQLNHPFDSGMLAAAGYADGVVQDADHWSDDFDAMEVINDNDHDEAFPAYLDMTARGLTPTPVGVSDSHGYRSGVGESVTFLHTDGAAVTDAVLTEAMGRQATVVSTGPYLEVTADGQWAPGTTLTGEVELEVAVWSASWIPVDRLVVYIDGERVEELPVTGEAPERLRTTLSLAPDEDAVVVLVAESDSRSHTVYDNQPWAMAAAIRIDVDGDGWQAPLPAITVE